MKRKELAIPSRMKVFNSIQNDTYLQSNVYFSRTLFFALKIRHGKFLANI